MEFVNYMRFDIFAKYIYVKYNEMNIQSDWHVQLYKQHILVFNGGTERYKNTEEKKSVDEFVFVFNEIIKSIKKYGFDDKISTIPIGKYHGNQKHEFILLNGSHRLATCLFFDKLPNFQKTLRFAPKYDYQFFQTYKQHVSTGLTIEYTDPMALEFCRLHPDSKIVVLFPKANYKDFEKDHEIVYKKQLKFNALGLYNFIHHLYDDEMWLKPENNWKGLVAKFKQCIINSTPDHGIYTIYVYAMIIDVYSAQQIKKKYRTLWNNRDTIHINDTHEESIYIAQTVFNNHSIDYLNYVNEKTIDPITKNLFEVYRKKYKNNEHVCIDSSFVMGLYGLRPPNDLDFIHNSKYTPILVDKIIKSHNKHLVPYLKNIGLSIDDIIYNPKNHFYIHGVKVCLLSIVKKIKEIRNEQKDKIDVILMNFILEKK